MLSTLGKNLQIRFKEKLIKKKFSFDIKMQIRAEKILYIRRTYEVKI